MELLPDNTIALTPQELLDILTRDGLRPFAAPSPELGLLLKLSDPSEEVLHVEELAVWRIRDWKESEQIRAKQVAESARRMELWSAKAEVEKEMERVLITTFYFTDTQARKEVLPSICCAAPTDFWGVMEDASMKALWEKWNGINVLI